MKNLISRSGSVEFIGDIYKDQDISAIDISGKFLILGSDESNQIQVLQRQGDNYKVIHSIALANAGIEIDIEGITCKENCVYVIGSHSWKRKKVDPAESYEKNREAIEKVTPEPDRDRLYCITLDDQGHALTIEETSLRSIIDSNNILKVFSQIPSKENGVDIEGLAIRKGYLYIGFRGPVLRENWVPVLKCQFAKTVTEAELIYVNLDGQGFRDITPVDNGFLILAGPAGDGLGSYPVYFWNGKDCLPGERSSGKVGQIQRLGIIPTHVDEKAEGLALLKESDSKYKVLIVYDSKKNGAPTRFSIHKP